MQLADPPRKSSLSLKPVLLEQAFHLLDREGPDGVTIRAVARAAGVSHAAPANHFADRKQLLTEVATIIFGEYLEKVEHLARSRSSNRAKAYLLGLFEYSQAYPARYQLLWRKDLIDWENPAFLDTLETAYQDFLRSFDGSDRLTNADSHDVETLGTATWSMVHGYSLLMSTSIFEARSDRVTGQSRIEAMLELLLPDQG